VGAGAVTNLEEPARSVNMGAHICQIGSESGPISDSNEEITVPLWYSVRGRRIKCLTSWEAWTMASDALRRRAEKGEEEDTRA
jgi:hypothetical protein